MRYLPSDKPRTFAALAIAGIAIAGLVCWAECRRRAGDDDPRKPGTRQRRSSLRSHRRAFAHVRGAGAPAGRTDWDRVDQAGDESFPASDPPSFNPTRL